jgi:hypothetical protein
VTRYAVGQPFRLSTVTLDIAGVVADPTDISLSTLCTADGVSASYAYNPGPIVRDSVGHFHLDLSTLVTVGHYTYAWLATGTNQGVTPTIGAFELYNPLQFNVVSTDDAREYLRMVDGTDVPADDNRLATIISSVTDGLTRIVGPLVPTTYTETVKATGCIQLGHGPVRSLTSVTGLGSTATVAVGDLVVLPGDVVERLSRTGLFGLYRVVYSAGPDAVAADVRGAALDWVLHRWRQSQAHGSATYGELVPDFLGPPNVVLNQIRHYLITRSGV